jgi:hypothetical protein
MFLAIEVLLFGLMIDFKFIFIVLISRDLSVTYIQSNRISPSFSLIYKRNNFGIYS